MIEAILKWFQRKFPFFSSINGSMFLLGCGLVVNICQHDFIPLACLALLFFFGLIVYMLNLWVAQQELAHATKEFMELAEKYNKLLEDREDFRLLVLEMNELIPEEIRGDSTKNPAKKLLLVP